MSRVGDGLTTKVSTEPPWTNSTDRVVRFRAVNSAGTASSISENRWILQPVVSGAAGRHVAATQTSSGRGAVPGCGVLLQPTVMQRTPSVARIGGLQVAL